MKLVERGNRQLQIPDELLEDYIEKGYIELVVEPDELVSEPDELVVEPDELVVEPDELVVEPKKPKKPEK